MSANEPGQPPAATGEVSFNLATPGVALAVGAHPDDVEFGCGGTLAKWADDGCVVHHVICTDGSKGTWDVAADTAQLAARREMEQREAARQLAGDRAGEVVFLGYTDGELPSDLPAVGRLAKVIRDLRPDVVFGHDPWKQYRLHPDHRNAGRLVCDAIVAARDPHFFPDHGVPHHRPEALLLFEAQVVDHIEDVSAYVDHKLAALEAHETQFETTMHAVDSSGLGPFRSRIRKRLGGLGQPYGFPAAEAFKLMTDL